MINPRDLYASHPIDPAVWAFGDAHSDFRIAMKAWYDRFYLLPVVFCSRLPQHVKRHEDQVLGFWYLDKENLREGKGPRFKQDFVVNVGGRSEKFVVYTSPSFLQGRDSPLAQPLGNFVGKYGFKGRYYCPPGQKVSHSFHHFEDSSQLPPEIRPWGEAAERFYPASSATVAA